jgi:hypothetical protein
MPAFRSSRPAIVSLHVAPSAWTHAIDVRLFEAGQLEGTLEVRGCKVAPDQLVGIVVPIPRAFHF